jgi:hypothetical protein
MNSIHRSFTKTPPAQRALGVSLHLHTTTKYEPRPNMIRTFSEKENFGFRDIANPDVESLTLQSLNAEMPKCRNGLNDD